MPPPRLRWALIPRLSKIPEASSEGMLQIVGRPSSLRHVAWLRSPSFRFSPRPWADPRSKSHFAFSFLSPAKCRIQGSQVPLKFLDPPTGPRFVLVWVTSPSRWRGQHGLATSRCSAVCPCRLVGLLLPGVGWEGRDAASLHL